MKKFMLLTLLMSGTSFGSEGCNVFISESTWADKKIEKTLNDLGYSRVSSRNMADYVIDTENKSNNGYFPPTNIKAIWLREKDGQTLWGDVNQAQFGFKTTKYLLRSLRENAPSCP